MSNENVIEKEKEKREAKRGFFKLAVIIIAFIAITFFQKNVIDIAVVVGPSMEDTFHNGDILLVDVRREHFERYDVVTLRQGEEKLIKRVIGMPGETIQIVNGKVLINGQELPDRYEFFTERAGVAGEEYLIREDEYFVLGDNRDESRDSRDFGSVRSEAVIGKVTRSLYQNNKNKRER